MKNQKVQTFAGNYIFPFGKPNVIITGWETKTNLYCERFVIFEKWNGEIINTEFRSHISKSDYYAIDNSKDEKQALSGFMKLEGKMLAESDVFNILIELREEVENGKQAVNMEIQLYTTQTLTDIIYLHRKFTKNLNWLETKTQSTMLKDLINLSKRFNIEESRF